MVGTFISAEDCRRVLTPSAVLEAVEECLHLDGTQSITWPTPRTLDIRGDGSGNDYHVKACVLERSKIAGVRVVAHPLHESEGTSTRFILLIDAVTTQPLATVDDSWTYARRTVANLLFMAHQMATTNVDRVALVGAGTLAAAALPYVSHLFPSAEIVIASRREKSRAALADRARMDFQMNATYAAPEEAISGAQIILAVTGAGRPVMEDSWIGEGAVVGCVETAECGDAFYRNADARIVDSREQLQKELVSCYGTDAADLVDATMGEVVRGLHPGRTDPAERILLLSQGLVSQDVALAHWAFVLASNQIKGHGGFS